MAHKELKYDAAARRALEAGVDAVANAVKVTLGPRGRYVVLAANKVDDLRGEAEAAALWNLGLGEPHPVSALHGRGSGDLLDAVLAALPETPSMDDTVTVVRFSQIIENPERFTDARLGIGGAQN